MRQRRATALMVRRGTPVEVLLVERSPELRFFGGYHAFPGGVMDREDGDADTLAALRTCAARELFEETGFWLGDDTPNHDAELRRALLDGDRTAWDRATRGGGDSPGADTERLTLLGDITTPPFAPVRYHTTFFEVEVAAGAEPEIWPGELTGARFWRPAAALEAWRRGELLIVPPVLFALETLATDESTFAARFQEATAALAAGHLHEIRFTPGILLAPLETETRPPATTTNTMLIGEDELWIVDPAPRLAAEQERLFAMIDSRKQRGIAPAGVLLTHHHPDHCGAARAVCERYGIPLLAHERCLERLPAADRPGDCRAIHDGDSLPLGKSPDGRDGWRLHVIATPGHSSDHLAFLEDRYRTVIAGDLLSSLSTVAIDPRDGHLRSYIDSLEKLRARNPGTILPAHGPGVRDGHAFIAATLRHRQAREDKLRSALQAEARTVTDLLPVVYDDVDEALWPLAELSLRAGLIKLVEDGVARTAGDGWQLRQSADPA